MNRRALLPIAAGLAGLGAAFVFLLNRPADPMPPGPADNGSGSQPLEESPGPVVAQDPPAPTPTTIPDTAQVRFGNVPFPQFTDRLIPDSQNAAWSDLGRRNVKGVVYHRTQGTIDGTDAWLRLVPPGGPDECNQPGTGSNFGGCMGLVDFGVDENSGEILRWNDPYGEGYPDLDVSPNRAPWANGPVEDPFGEAEAFISQNGVDAVNRDQASIQIGGNFDDPISDACKRAVAALSAYFADQYNIRWNEYPKIPGESYGFVRWHNQFYPFRECPGPVVTDATDEIIDLTREILREHQIV